MVLGVDTHKDLHVAAVLTAVGVLLATESFPTTTAGYRRLLQWAREFGTVERAGVECSGSYGAALARHLTAERVSVIEVNRADRGERRRRGKSDTLDAEAAARAALPGRATAIAKSGDGHVEMLRMFKLAKVSAVKSRTQAINQLKAVLVRADPSLREAMSGLTHSGWPARPPPPRSAGSARSRPPQVALTDVGSTAAVTDRPTRRSKRSRSPACGRDQLTRSYVQRRINEGKTRREAIRCLKR